MKWRRIIARVSYFLSTGGVEVFEKKSVEMVDCPCLTVPNGPKGCDFCGGITSPHSRFCENCGGTGKVPKES